MLKVASNTSSKSCCPSLLGAMRSSGVQAGIHKFVKKSSKSSENESSISLQRHQKRGSASCGDGDVSLLDMLANNHPPQKAHIYPPSQCLPPAKKLRAAAYSIQPCSAGLKTSTSVCVIQTAAMAAVKLAPSQQTHQQQVVDRKSVLHPRHAEAQVVACTQVSTSKPGALSEPYFQKKAPASCDQNDAKHSHHSDQPLLDGEAMAAAAQRQVGPNLMNQPGAGTATSCHTPHRDNNSQAEGSNNVQPCPLCGMVLPVEQLQQHVDSELQELEQLEQLQSHQVQQLSGCQSNQAGPQQHDFQHQASWPGWQAAAQQSKQQRHPQQQLHMHQPQWQLQQQQCLYTQQQQGQQRLHMQQQQRQPAAQRPQQEPQHFVESQQAQQQQPPKSLMRYKHNPPAQLRHKPARAGNSSSAHFRGGTSSRSSVKGLSLAPSKQRSGDDPAPQMFDSFDHWGDSASNWMDDYMIGLEGAPRSAAECWEGVGSCAIGPRHLG